MMNNNLNIKELKQPVVITGAFGFIGHRVVDKLIELGAREVVAFDLPGFSLPKNWLESVRYIEGDVSHQSDVEKAMKGAGTVIHLAAMVGDWIPLALHEKVTLRGSRYIFEAAIRNNTRVVLSSSIVVYADRLTKGVCEEDKQWGNPVGPYSICKQKQEELAWDYFKDKNMQLSVVRPANVYGPGSKPWVHDVVDTLKAGAPALIGGGEFNAALVYVDNVVQLLLLSATKEAALGQVFNGGDGNTVSWKTYLSDLSEVLEISKPKSVPLWVVKPLCGVMEKTWKLLKIKTRPPLTKEALNIVCAGTDIPIRKAQDLLGYQPQVDYALGLQHVKAYVKQKLM